MKKLLLSALSLMSLAASAQSYDVFVPKEGSTTSVIVRNDKTVADVLSEATGATDMWGGWGTNLPAGTVLYSGDLMTIEAENTVCFTHNTQNKTAMAEVNQTNALNYGVEKNQLDNNFKAEEFDDTEYTNLNSLNTLAGQSMIKITPKKNGKLGAKIVSSGKGGKTLSYAIASTTTKIDDFLGEEFTAYYIVNLINTDAAIAEVQADVEAGKTYWVIAAGQNHSLYEVSLVEGGAESSTATWSSTKNGEAIADYANLGAQGEASVVKIQLDGLEGEHISGPVAKYIDGPLVDGKLEADYNNGWDGPKTQALSKDGSVAPLVYMQGKGNPVNLDLVTFEEIVTDGKPTGNYKANWDAAYYNPDGSAGGPKNGTYVSLTPKTDGVIKVGIWVNKGNRETFVCSNKDYKAMAFGTDVKVSGYVQATTWTEEETADENLIGYMKFQEEIAPKGTEGNDAYIIGAGNRPIWAYLTFSGKAGETYYVFNKSTQIGIMDVEFTTATGVENIAVERPIKTNVIYNLAGQVVDENYKGIVIKNGKKYLMK